MAEIGKDYVMQIGQMAEMHSLLHARGVLKLQPLQN